MLGMSLISLRHKSHSREMLRGDYTHFLQGNLLLVYTQRNIHLVFVGHDDEGTGTARSSD
jgi:hypothetical protein